MELIVYWTDFAEDKLEDVYTYYAEKASARIAHRLVGEIIDKSLELEKNPLSGQREILLSDRPQEFRYLVCRNYKIIYWVNADMRRIEVVNLYDCRQNPVKISIL